MESLEEEGFGESLSELLKKLQGIEERLGSLTLEGEGIGFGAGVGVMTNLGG